MKAGAIRRGGTRRCLSPPPCRRQADGARAGGFCPRCSGAAAKRVCTGGARGACDQQPVIKLTR